jgi:hypothetical protein
MRYLLYRDRGLIDANVATVSALRERLRAEVAVWPWRVSDLNVLVFDSDDVPFLGRRSVLVVDGHPVLVPPGLERCVTDQGSNVPPGWTDPRFVVA